MSDPYPTTLDGFLEGRNLIVIARIGDVEYSKFYGFDLETGKPIVPTEEDILCSGATSMADFTLEVEEVLWADADYRPDEPVVLKTIWSDDLSDEGVKAFKESLMRSGLKAPEKGDRYLFILTRNLDGTYSVPYDEQRLIVGEDGILYYSQMYPPYPIKVGEFREGERYGEAKGPPLTVDDLVRAAEALAMKGESVPDETTSPQPEAEAYAMIRSYPPTLDGLLKDTNLIVMAKLGAVEYSKFYGFDPETGKRIVPSGDEILCSISNMADFTLEVEEVFWADAAYRPDEPLVLSTMFWGNDLSAEGIEAFKEFLTEGGLKPFETGDRYLFLLSRNPDGTYSALSEEQRLTVGEDGILYYSQMNSPYIGEFREGDLAGGTQGPPLTVDDLVRAATALAGEPGVSRSDLNDARNTIYLPLTPAQ